MKHNTQATNDNHSAGHDPSHRPIGWGWLIFVVALMIVAAVWQVA
jgi:hypothetical protein